MKIIAKCL